MIEAGDHVWITLNDDHLSFCDRVAIKRRENAVEFGLLPANNAPTEYEAALKLDRLGLPGELAGKLYLNPVKWHAFRRGTNFTEADLEDWIDVKTRRKSWHSLIVQFDDPPDWAYVLVSAHLSPRFCLIGWCWGYEAQKQEFIDDPAGNRAAYFIRQDNPVLHPMAELLAEVRRRQPFFTEDGLLMHYCHCGKWGAYGVGVSLLKGKLGAWYCDAHRP